MGPLDIAGRSAISDNTSGHGAAAVVPPEATRWNWGAFLLNWIWGLGNGTFIALLMFVPFVNLLMPFVLGAKGGEWAWRNRRWDSLQHFQRVQRLWAIWGLVSWIAVIGLVAAMVFTAIGAMRSSDAYQQAVRLIESNPLATAALGTPVQAGIPLGSIQINGPSGAASLQFSVTGPKSGGTAYVEATRSMGKWQVDRAELEVDGRDDRIILAGAKGLPI